MDAQASKKCERCGTLLSEVPPPSGRCPGCRSSYWGQPFPVAAGDPFEIIELSASGTDSLSMSLRMGGNMPYLVLDGRLLQNLRARASVLDLPVGHLLGLTVTFGRSPTGEWSVQSVKTQRLH